MNKLLLAAFTVWLIIVSIIIHKLQRVVPEVLPVIEQIDQPISPLDQLINDTAASYGLDSKLFHCVLQIESGKRLGAINSATGDYGIGQINVRSWSKFDVGRLTTDLQYSLNASAEVLSFYKQLKQADEPRQWACRYNVGPGPLTQRNRAYNCEIYLEKLSSCMNK